MRKLFTSESVTEGHPDKMADQISDGILDAILEKDPMARVACETFLTTGMALIAGEISTNCYVDMPKIVRETIREIGYTNATYGFDCNTSAVLTPLMSSPPILQWAWTRRWKLGKASLMRLTLLVLETRE